MDLPRPPAPAASIPPQKRDGFVRVIATVRDNLLKLFFLLRVHLDKADLAATLIRQRRNG
ncbi:MAG: hypothetical protein VW475_03120 [Curvibacter sp.]